MTHYLNKNVPLSTLMCVYHGRTVNSFCRLDAAIQTLL